MSNIVPSVLRQLSHQTIDANNSVFYEENKNDLDKFFNVNSSIINNNLDSFYITSRANRNRSRTLKRLKDRLPTDIKQLTEPSRGKSVSLGSSEIEFIDLMLSGSEQRVINLIGNVGIGKSTFLTYLFRHVRAYSSTLSSFNIIFVNCLAVGNNPSKLDILQQVCSSIDPVVSEECQLSDIIKHYAAKDVANNTTIISFIKDVEDAIKPKYTRNIVIFDNVDQIKTKKVAKIIELARGLFINTRSYVIVPMRPPTYETNYVTLAEKGSFPRYKFVLEPPDFRAVLESRLAKALESSRHRSDQKTRRFSLDDYPRLIKSIGNFLSPETDYRARSRDALFCLSAGNLRMCLIGALFAMKSRKFDDLIQSILTPDSGHDPRSRGLGFLIDCMMIGPYDFFDDRRTSSGEESSVTNILYFRNHDNLPDYLIIYRTLSLLRWAGRIVKSGDVVTWLLRLGYVRVDAISCLSHLLQRGLIGCASSESTVTARDPIYLTRPGEFYIERLIGNEKYVLNCILDCPLQHCAWGRRSKFLDTFASLMEYLDKVEELEVFQIDLLQRSDRVEPSLIPSFEYTSLLSRQILNMALKIRDDFGRSRDDEARRKRKKFLDAMSRKINVADERISVLEEEVERTVRERYDPRYSSGPRRAKLVLDDGESFIDMPAFVVQNGSDNRVDVEIDLDEADLPENLYALLSFSDSDIPVALTRLLNIDDGTFKGTYVFPQVINDRKLDGVMIRVFNGARELFGQKLSI